MKDCLVTLIVSIYNGEKNLVCLLESIINQTYRNLEVILVDDGSTDSSGEIAEMYAKKDDRFFVVHQENQGVSVARNLGLTIMHGEYVGIIDQDDCLHKDYVKILLDLIDRFNVEIATAVDTKNFIGNPPLDRDLSYGNCKISKGEDVAKDMLMHNLQIGPWNKIISKKLLESSHIRFQPQFYCGEGLAFSVEIFQVTDKVAVTNEKIYYYRIDNSSSGSSTFSVKKLRSALAATDYIKIKLKDKSKYAARIIEFEKWRTIINWFVILKLSKEKEKYPEECRFLKRESRKKALSTLLLPVRFKQKLNAILFFISPELGSFILGKKISLTTGGKYS